MSAKQNFRIGALVCLSEKGLRYYLDEESWTAIIIGWEASSAAWKMLMNDEQIGWIERNVEDLYEVIQ